jgi:N-acyl-D-amino-acid deacylase
MIDLLIRGARIVDGSGEPAYKGDIGIQGDRIVALGDLAQPPANEQGEGPTVIDASGLVAAPGFVDMHTHSDWTLPGNRKAESKIRQGVTTEVIGMCGSSPAPVPSHPARRKEWMARASASQPWLTWEWEGFGQYLDHLRQGIALNVVPLAGHATLRVAAMGWDYRAPTGEELVVMQRLLAQAMEEGAWGYSTGLIYPPSCYAQTEELISLARIVSRHRGFYFSHIRGEGATLLDSIREVIAIAEGAEVPAQIAHFKASGQPYWDRLPQAIDLVKQARSRGLDITADRYPYVASSTGLAAVLPHWVHEGGRDALLGRLADPLTRARVRQEVIARREGIEWGAVMISSCPPKPACEGLTIAQLAEGQGVEPVDAALDLLLEAEGQVSMVQFSMSEENLHQVLSQPWVMIGSDGSSLAPYGEMGKGKRHPRSYGTFVRVLGKYVRQKGLLTWEEAVRKMAALPAKKLGLMDRGLLEVRRIADIVLFDPLTVCDQATFTEPYQYPVGIEYVLVNGRVVIERGEHTGALAGRVLERQA